MVLHVQISWSGYSITKTNIRISDVVVRPEEGKSGEAVIKSR